MTNLSKRIIHSYFRPSFHRGISLISRRRHYKGQVGATPPKQWDIYRIFLIMVTVIIQFFDQVAQAVQCRLSNSATLLGRPTGKDPACYLESLVEDAFPPCGNDYTYLKKNIFRWQRIEDSFSEAALNQSKRPGWRPVIPS